MLVRSEFSWPREVKDARITGHASDGVASTSAAWEQDLAEAPSTADGERFASCLWDVSRGFLQSDLCSTLGCVEKCTIHEWFGWAVRAKIEGGQREAMKHDDLNVWLCWTEWRECSRANRSILWKCADDLSHKNMLSAVGVDDRPPSQRTVPSRLSTNDTRQTRSRWNL